MAARLRAHRLPSPPLTAFLAMPLPERLMFLAKLDGADTKTIKSLLGATDQDVALESDRMIAAARLLTAAMDESWDFIPEGDLDTQLGQLVFPYLPAILIGEAVPPQLASLSLKQRLAIYLVLVERKNYKRTRPEVQQLLGCTELFCPSLDSSRAAARRRVMNHDAFVKTKNEPSTYVPRNTKYW